MTAHGDSASRLRCLAGSTERIKQPVTDFNTMVNNCCVKECTSRSTAGNGVTFHRIPTIITTKGIELHELTERRTRGEHVSSRSTERASTTKQPSHAHECVPNIL